MRSINQKVFMSCSFTTEDQDVVNFFKCICNSVDCTCINVQDGYALTPPTQAREMIEEVKALIAIATKREEKADGTFLMPEAVEEEMSMAFALKKPILLFVEKGVDISQGFKQNYGTYLEFDRSKLYDLSFLEKVIRSIHNLKCQIFSEDDFLIQQQGHKDFFSEKASLLIELIETDSEYTWRYTNSKKIIFNAKMAEPLVHASWAGVPVIEKENPPNIIWKCFNIKGSKKFDLISEEVINTPTRCDLSIKIDPIPEKDDFLEYSITMESPYLAPIFNKDIEGIESGIIIEDDRYYAFDGVVPIIRTKQLIFQFRAPSSYGLSCSDLKPFVSSHSNTVDYIVSSEIDRANIDSNDFGGNVEVTIKTESPLLYHLYGVAWNPPSKNC